MLGKLLGPGLEMTSQVGFVAALIKLTEQTAGRDKLCRYKTFVAARMNISILVEWCSTAPVSYTG